MVNPFSSIDEFTSGEYLLHLPEVEVVENVIAVDADRRLILDGVEPYPMRLSEEVLRLCGGQGAKNLTLVCTRRLIEPRKLG